MKSGTSSDVDSLQVFSFIVKVLPFVAELVRSESLDAVKSGASLGVYSLQVFSFIVKVLPFVAELVRSES